MRKGAAKGAARHREKPVAKPTSETLAKMQAFDDSWRKEDKFDIQRSSFVNARNILIRRLSVIFARDAPKLDVTQDLLLMEHIFQSCLIKGEDDIFRDFPDSSFWDGKEDSRCNRHPLGALCVLMGNPFQTHDSSAAIIKLAYECLPRRTSPLHKGIRQILVDFSSANPEAFAAAISATGISMIYPKEPFKVFTKLEDIIDELVTRNPKLITCSFVDAGVELVHSNILNSCFISASYLNVGYSILSKMGICCIKMGYLTQLSNISKVFQDMLFDENLNNPANLTKHYCEFLTNMDIEWLQFSISNLLFYALKLNAKDMISTRTVIYAAAVRFPLLVNYILPLLNSLVVTRPSQKRVDYVASIYIFLLNPPNIDLGYFPQIVARFQQFLGSAALPSIDMPPECVKMSLMYTTIGLTDCPELKLYLCTNRVGDKMIKYPTSTDIADLQGTGDCLRPFFIPFHLAFLLITQRKNKKVFKFLVNLVNDEIMDAVIDSLIYYQDFNLAWFEQSTFEFLAVIWGAYGDLTDADRTEIDDLTSQDSVTPTTATCNPFDETLNKVFNADEIAAPLYLECSERTALRYTNSLASLGTQKELGKDDLIIFDLFRFEKVREIKANLIQIFETCPMTEQFVNVMASQTGNSVLLSSIILGDLSLVDRIELSENRWAIVNGCTQEPVTQANVNCISIFSLLYCYTRYKGETPTNVKDCFKTITRIFYSKDHIREDKLAFWNTFAKYATNSHGKVGKKPKQALLEVYSEFGLKKCQSKVVNEQRIIIDNDLTALPVIEKTPKKKKKKAKNSEPIVTNEVLTVATAEGVDEKWPVTVTVYPKGKKMDAPGADVDLVNHLFDNERKLWFLKQRQIGIAKKGDPSTDDLMDSYDYYQRIMAFDLFRGIFEGKRDTGVFVGALFGSDLNFTLATIEEMDRELSKYLANTSSIHPLNALLLTEFITIFMERDLKKKYWLNVLNKLSEIKDDTVKLAVIDMLASVKMNFGVKTKRQPRTGDQKNGEAVKTKRKPKKRHPRKSKASAAAEGDPKAELKTETMTESSQATE